MPEMNPELKAAIDVAKELVTVDSYYNKTVTKGLFGHAKGYVGGSLLGMFTGALAALTCAGTAALAGITLPIGLGVLILGSVSVGAGAGGMVGSRVGASAGAISAGLEERERRDKGEKLEQEILSSPEKQREAIEAYRKNPVVEKRGTIEELTATHKGGIAKLFDVKTMIFAGALCAAVEAVVCAGAFLMMGGIGWGALVAADAMEAAVIGAGLGAASGASFGMAYPVIFGTLTQKASDMLRGNMVRGKSEFAHVKTIAEIQQEAVQNRIASESIPQMTVTRGGKMAASEVGMIPENSIAVPAAAERVVQLQPQLSA
jgi:hypothetical protein